MKYIRFLLVVMVASIFIVVFVGCSRCYDSIEEASEPTHHIASLRGDYMTNRQMLNLEASQDSIEVLVTLDTPDDGQMFRLRFINFSDDFYHFSWRDELLIRDGNYWKYFEHRDHDIMGHAPAIHPKTVFSVGVDFYMRYGHLPPGEYRVISRILRSDSNAGFEYALSTVGSFVIP